MGGRVIDPNEIQFLRAQGASHEEIARQLGVTVDGVEKAERRRARCRTCLDQIGVDALGVIKPHGYRLGVGHCAGTGQPPGTASTTPPDWYRTDTTHWTEQAACQDTFPELFFATDPAPAKAVCAGCPVRQECFEFAIESGADHGVWGGLDENERASLRRRRRS